jgi:class 3 adenylate cyclase/tetratricopeptide (TPR) repeat protein
VVSILFVDLVGFTERSDQADPEDVRRTLVPFHSAVKADIERFGGTLDKFIGDAALGVFGSPVAHEDDPERAIRAGLAILRSIEDLRRTDPAIAVRVAVNTGEAVVAFGTGPQVGEAVAGDVVNTTSRMQALAPRDSMVIGEGTLRAVRDLFDLEEQPPSQVKGKTEPLTVWRVLGERLEARPDLTTVEFVGRERELALLEELLDGSKRSSSIGLVTVTGEPGIGKSRLIDQLRRRTAGRTRWLAGRCLPYGEAITFAPAAATIREAAGIGAAFDASRQGSKLEALITAVETDPSEREWLQSTMERVLGIGGTEAGATIPAEETARAWARVVSWIAATSRPSSLVLHLDDLHWAEPVFLELVIRLTDRLRGEPVLVLCCSRPELLDRSEGWTTGRDDARVVRLEALSDEESAKLVDDLLERTAIPEPVRASLVERAGGNPLYALEFARMLEEGGLPSGEGPVAMPDSVQTVIAARLDAIPAGLRAFVQDAAVVGTAFWPGVLAALGDRSEASVADGLGELIQRGFIEPSSTSTLEGMPEYGFTHALIGEVAYGRIPRAQRARRHHAAGVWIERVDAERAEERAEMLARHFAAAVELAEAAGEGELAEGARGPAVKWLMAAGQRAGALNAPGSFVLYDRAARLAPSASGERAEALAFSAQMGRRGGRLDAREVLRRYEESLDIYRQMGDRIGIGRGQMRVGSQLGAMGEFGRSGALVAEAVAMLEREPHGADLARALAFRAEVDMFAGHIQASMESAGRALDLLPDGTHDDIRVMALHIRGDSRSSLGDLGGIQDLEEALRLSQASGSASDLVTSLSYLGEWLWTTQGPAAGMVHIHEGIRLAERLGVVSQGLWTKAGGLEALVDMGDWDRAVEWCADVLGVGQENLDSVLFAVATAVRNRIALYRGEVETTDSAAYLADLGRAVEELQALAPALLIAAERSLAGGQSADALAYVEEFDRATSEGDVAPSYRESRLAPLARVCGRAGDLSAIERMLGRSQGLLARDRLNLASARALVAHANGAPEAAGLYGAAGEGWRAFGVPLEEALALRGLALVTGEPEDPRARELLDGLGVPAGHWLFTGGAAL